MKLVIWSKDMAELLHEKIYNDLLNRILDHQYEEGDMLPTESEMEQIYAASKAPIRQALTRLQKAGFIIRKAGKGTFVSGRVNWPHANMGGHAEEFLQKGPLLYCKTLTIVDKALTHAETAYMHRETGSTALYLERMRYYKDKPIHYLQHYIIDPGVNLKEKLQLEGNFSSLLALYDKYGIKFGKTEDVLEAVAAPARVAEHLDVAKGTPLLLINRCTYNKDGSLLEFVKFYILTKEWKYRAYYLDDFV